jgi:thymidylate synthase
MNDYYNLLRFVQQRGDYCDNRTGIPTLSVTGASMSFDISRRFPLLTGRALPFKSVAAELLAFMEGATSAARFRALGTRIWDANANENKAWLASPFREGPDDLGPVYGALWRAWPAWRWFKDDQKEAAIAAGWQKVMGGLYYREIDQLQQAVDTLRRDPYDRRILFHAWNPALLDPMGVALPACHLLYQLHGRIGNCLDMTVYIRSNDLGLGAPFNIASAALLMHIIGRMVSRMPRRLTIMIGDAHIYTNHCDAMTTLLGRHCGDLAPVSNAADTSLHPMMEEPTFELPNLDYSGSVNSVLQQILAEGGAGMLSGCLHGYRPLSALPMEMAV